MILISYSDFLNFPATLTQNSNNINFIQAIKFSTAWHRFTLTTNWDNGFAYMITKECIIY